MMIVLSLYVFSVIFYYFSIRNYLIKLNQEADIADFIVMFVPVVNFLFSIFAIIDVINYYNRNWVDKFFFNKKNK